jgi:hypothetical protein
MSTVNTQISLKKEGDVLFAIFNDGTEKHKVKLVWVRPMTGRGKEISILDKDNKELWLLESIHEFDEVSRALALQVLEERYFIPKIIKVYHTDANFGNRYWEVETCKGKCTFAMRDPRKNINWLTENHLMLRDTLGNRYEIENLSQLDAVSQELIEKVV